MLLCPVPLAIAAQFLHRYVDGFLWVIPLNFQFLVRKRFVVAAGVHFQVLVKGEAVFQLEVKEALEEKICVELVMFKVTLTQYFHHSTAAM